MGKRLELDTQDISFHYRGIPTTEEELSEKNTSNKVLPPQTQSEAMD